MPVDEPVAAPPAAQDARTAAPTEGCPEDMRPVAGGTFVASVGAARTEVASLCVDATEVTVEAYEACVKERRCLAAPTDPRGARLAEASCNVSETSRGKHPINCIDGLLAESFCRALDRRLPMATEWQWIARGGAAAHRFAWGDEPPVDQACWSGPRALDGTCGVVGHPEDVTPDGVLGLSGNVAEWTRAPGSTGAVVRAYRVLGGSFASRDPEELSTAARCAEAAAPGAAPVVDSAPGARQLRLGHREICSSDALRSPVVGFRCVRSPAP
jgi:formylglycine-generating enzyme required for sulfatase activity